MSTPNSNISLIYGASIFLTMLFGMGASFLANKVYPMTGGADAPEPEDKGALGLGPGTPPEPKEELVPSPDAPTPKLAKGTAPLASDKLFDTPAPEPARGLGSAALADVQGGGVEYDSDTDTEDEEEEDSEEEAPPLTGGANTTWINPHAGFTPMNTNGLTYQF
jgi:hypothetical protein